MGILLVLAIIVAIVFAVFALKLFRSTFQVLSVVLFAIIFIAVILGFFAFQDLKSFRTTFGEKPTTYLLDNNGTLEAGFTLQEFNFTTFSPLNQDQLYDEFFMDGDRLIVVFSKSSLDLSMRGVNLSQGYTLGQALESPDYNLRAAAFLITVGATLRQESVWSVLTLVRSEEVMIYPETVLIKMLTFDSKGYKDRLQQQYNRTKTSVSDSVGMFKEVNIT